jgi:ABC-2 type transport system ATP-binding protein
VRLADPASADRAAPALADLAADEPVIDAAAGEIRLSVTDPSASAEAVRRLDARGVAIAAVELRQPSLDDVFLTLTGRRTDDEHTDQEVAA